MKWYLPFLVTILSFTTMLSLVRAQDVNPPPAPRVPDANPQPPAAEWLDDFQRYAIGGDASPNWDARDIGFGLEETDGRKVLAAGTLGKRGIMLWQAVPFASALRFEARATPQKPLGRPEDWRFGGIGLYADDTHFWHLALVERPQSAASPDRPQHFVELNEMLGDAWGAQSQPGTRLAVQEQSPNFEWQYGASYRLRLTLARENGLPIIRGEVWEGAQLRWHTALVLSSEDGKNRVVAAGRPMLVDSNLKVAFTEAHAAAVTPATEAPASKIVIPPYTALTKFAPAKGGPPVGPATGFFRVAQTGDRWWLFDPLGTPTLSVGTDHVNYLGHYSEKLGYSPYNRNVTNLYPDEAAWAQETARRLGDWRFNVLGAGSGASTRYRGLAHTEFLSFGADFSAVAALVEKTTWTGFPDVFDPRWVRFCDLRAKEKCAAQRDDPWLLGYFLDNELEWWGKGWVDPPWGMALETAKQPAASYGKHALLATLRRAYGDDLAAFNTDFTTNLQNWDGFLALTALPVPGSERARSALMGWVGEVAQKYFEVTTAAVRRYDPNHLTLGCRFAFDAPDAAWRFAGQTCDIVTVNVYPRVDFPSRHVIGLAEHLGKHYALCHKPMILSEWSFPALDAKDSQGQPIPSKHGAGMRVDTQQQKAAAYSIMQGALFRTPYVVGSHYFMWTDEPATGVSSTFPEDSNYGLVNEADEPYPELTAAARAVNAQVLSIHAGNAFSPPAPEAFAVTPEAAALLHRTGVIAMQRDGLDVTVENGALRVKSENGVLKVAALSGETYTDLGDYLLLLQQVVKDQQMWVKNNAIESVTIRENSPQRWVAEIMFAYKVAGAAVTENSAQPWRANVRITIEAGRPWFTAQVLQVENTGTRSWDWKGYYQYTPSHIGGDAADDNNATDDVYNYWLQAGAWHDAKVPWYFGMLSPREDERLHIVFWKDKAGKQHPDGFRAVNGQLAPNATWMADKDEPPVVIFALPETPANPRPWSTVAQFLQSEQGVKQP